MQSSSTVVCCLTRIPKQEFKMQIQRHLEVCPYKSSKLENAVHVFHFGLLRHPVLVRLGTGWSHGRQGRCGGVRGGDVVPPVRLDGKERKRRSYEYAPDSNGGDFSVLKACVWFKG